MSTRSCLAEKTEKGFEGIYCHYDGYPTNRGEQIWAILMKDFVLNRGQLGISNDGSKSLQAFVDIYIKGHKAGWSSFPDVCYCHDKDFVMRDGVGDMRMNEKTADALFIEWVYAIDVKKKTLVIYVGGRAEGKTEQTGVQGNKYKSPNYTFYHVCELEINADAKEPDWKMIEKQGSRISNEMYKLYK